MVQEGTVYLIANYILFVMLFISTDLICERRFKWWLQLLFDLLAALIMLVSMLFFSRFTNMRFTAGCVTFLLQDILLHRGKLTHRILTSTLSFLCMIFSEVVYMAVMPRDAAVSGELYQMDPIALYAVYLFLSAVVISIMVVAFRYLHSKYQGAENAKQWLLFPIFPISQLAALLNFAAIYIQKEFKLWGLITTIIVFILADIALVIFIRMTARNAKLEVRTELLEEQIGSQKEYYKQLTDSYEKVRKMRHDIDNHLYTIQALLASGETKEAEAYNARVTAQTDLSEDFDQCWNKVVASYLEKKKEDLEAEQIPFETKIVMPQECGIENPDLICVLGNLLNNAQEASVGLKDGFISLEISYKEPYLSICVKNRVEEQESKKKIKRIAELERGIGMTILEEMAQQYDGNFKIQSENNVFRADLVLKGRSHVDDSDL